MNNVSYAANNKKIHILTSFAVRDGFDLCPTSKAIESACKKELVQQIHILSETDKSIALATMPILRNPKVVFVQTRCRPSFAELFNYSNLLNLGDNAVVALMNSDVSFETDEDIDKSVRALDLMRSCGQLGVLVITRHDLVDDVPMLTLYEESGIPNCLSSDCWVFRPPLKINDVDYFHLGDMNCDCLLAFALAESKIPLLNPCVDIKVIHYEEAKSNAYYEQIDKKQSSQDLLSWHWAKNCNHPYTTFGVAWSSLRSIELGYLPNAMIYQKKRIYFSLRFEKSIDRYSKLLALIEIIAKTNFMDVVVLFEEHSLTFDFASFKEIFSRSKNVYIFPVKSLNSVFDFLISEKNRYGQSCALIRRFQYLTSDLLHEFHSIILDLNEADLIASTRTSVSFENLKCFSENRYPKIIFDNEVFFDGNSFDSSSCTLITSVYRSDKYISGFVKNMEKLFDYAKIPHIILISKLSDFEYSTIINHSRKNDNVIVCWLKSDPGLYECWNIGVRVSQTEFVSNANVDDLRSASHVKELIELLNSNPSSSFAASCIVPFDNYQDEIHKIKRKEIWYTDQSKNITFDDLAKLVIRENTISLSPHNIPHCMPIWRKALHGKYGYFNEEKYGTYADWAFWLTITKQGETGSFCDKPLAYYYINISSHNRRGIDLQKYHDVIERDFLGDFFTILNSSEFCKFDMGVNKREKLSNALKHPQKKIYLDGLCQSFGQHRNKFNNIINALLPLHSEESNLRFIPFIEKYFVWGSDVGEAKSCKPEAIIQPWIGILHVPFDAPIWFDYKVSPEVFFETKLWTDSLVHCKGIICLSKDMERDLKFHYPEMTVFSIKHPTELIVKKFNFDSYIANPKVVQVGDWLRELQFIYKLKAGKHKKIMLKKRYTQDWLEKEVSIFGDYRNDSVDVIEYIPDDQYDDLLSSSIVVTWMYASSANNILLECIARTTPILINPLPSVVEYLGEGYPLYIHNLTQAAEILTDLSKIKDGYEYLKRRNDLRDSISYDSFFKSFSESDFYINL